jgi:MFS family permease
MSKMPIEGMRIGEILERYGLNRSLLALSIARFGDAVGNSILFIIIPLYTARLKAPLFPFPESVRVGILIFVFGMVNFLLQPLTGALSDRIGRRKPFIEIGLLVMSAATLSYVFANRFIDLLLIRCLQGAGLALTVPPSLALITATTERENRGSAMGVFTTMRMLGLTVGPLLGGFLFDRYGFNSAFYTGSGCIACGAVLVQVLIREKLQETEKRPQGRFSLLDLHLLNPSIIAAGIVILVMASAFAMLTTLEKQFNSRLHQTTLAFGIALSAPMVSRLMLQFPLGRLSDRFGRKPFILGGLILMAPATVLIGWVKTTLQLMLFRALQGVGSAAIAAPVFALAGDLSTEGGEGRQMSIVAIGFSLGIALGPLLAGVLNLYSIWLPFLAGGVLLVFGLFCAAIFMKETVQR